MPDLDADAALEAIQTAGRILAQLWPAVVEIARALLERRIVSGEELRSVLGQHAASPFDPVTLGFPANYRARWGIHAVAIS